MISKKPRPARLKKRASVRFGTTPELISTGFTLNLSSRGLAVATQHVQPMQKHLFFEVTVGNERFKAEGVVVWSQRGVLIAGVPSSMGIRLTWADASYFEFIASLTGERSAAPAITAPAEDTWPELEKVRVNESAVEETLPDFITMLMDGSPDAPTPIEVEPLRDRIDRAPRYDERLPVEFGQGVLLKLRGLTMNLSTTGLALASSEPIEPGELVVFTVRGRDGTVGRGTGVVAWAYSGDSVAFDAHAAIGIRLTYADGKYQRIIDRVAMGL